MTRGEKITAAVRSHRRGLFSFLKGMVGSSLMAASLSVVWWAASAEGRLARVERANEAHAAILETRTSSVVKLENVATRLDATVRESDRFREDMISRLDAIAADQREVNRKIDRLLEKH